MAKTYARSAYTNPFSATVQRNNAKARGWGDGWPNCQSGKMKTVLVQDTDAENLDFRVTVRREVAEMVGYLLLTTDRQYNILRSETGAYNCRPIAGTRTPSNHSWGLAVDINWNHNPMSTTFHSEIPPAVVAMWNKCGWYWGGFYANRHDTMHFEYVGKPADVAKHTALAKKYAQGNTTPTPAPAPTTSTWGSYFKGTIGSRDTKQWHRGDDVKLLQRYFGLKDDGYFGRDTEKKVQDWQMSRDLPATGVVHEDKEWKIIKAAVKGI